MALEDKVRARVIAELRIGEKTVRQIAKSNGVSVGTVQKLKDTLTPEQVQAIEEQKGINLRDLVAGYLEEGMITLRAQAKFFRDENWLKRQGADAAAINHGVLADKMVRVIESAAKFERGQEASSADATRSGG